ncbi:hypothetical protein ACFL2X_02980 [Candidatus Latescibacterota bacterium]
MRLPIGKYFIITFLTYLLCTVLIINCSKNSTGNDDGLNLSPFKKLATEEGCAENRNNLYLIDKSLVFWEREGECPDNMFAQTLYGEKPEDIKCKYNDSIAGPVYICNDSTYHEMFQTIIVNLDYDNLGLSSEHTVEDILF